MNGGTDLDRRKDLPIAPDIAVHGCHPQLYDRSDVRKAQRSSGKALGSKQLAASVVLWISMLPVCTLPFTQRDLAEQRQPLTEGDGRSINLSLVAPGQSSVLWSYLASLQWTTA